MERWWHKCVQIQNQPKNHKSRPLWHYNHHIFTHHFGHVNVMNSKKNFNRYPFIIISGLKTFCACM